MKRDRPAVLILHPAPAEGAGDPYVSGVPDGQVPRVAGHPCSGPGAGCRTHGLRASRGTLQGTPDTYGASAVWRESDAGVLEETKAVAAALDRLGLAHRTVGVARLTDVPGALAAAPEEVVFNLVEGFPGRPFDAGAVPALCRAFDKGCTGADSPCLLLAQDKGRTKALLQAAGLPCPPAVVVPVGENAPAARLPGGPYIVKPVCLDASEGIDAASVVPKAGAALRRAVARVHREFGQPAMVEQFIAGRELNVSVLERRGRVEVLPIAEIVFSAFPAGKPRIVDYAAKWLPESFEYRHTPRIIPARLTARQAEAMRRQARAAWDAVGCSGYARVDFRLDARGRPMILEVNANPDIADDAGFAAALEAAGIPFEEFVDSAVRDAWQTLGRRTSARVPRRVAARQAGRRIRWAEPRDRDAVLAFVARTGFFRADEVAVAQELLDDALATGPPGHYQSLVAEDESGAAVGWVCFGPTPCTIGTFDIYWIVVAPDAQRRGIGAALMVFAEERIAERGGRLAVVETSGRPVYDPTRGFYLNMGYREAARIADFYAAGDAKVVYTKAL